MPFKVMFEALRPAGPHRARPARRQPDRRCAEELLGDLTVKLKAWTGRSWMVSLSREEGGPTLAEIEASKRETAILDAKSDPAVAAILARFPGAKIIDVRIPDAPEAESDEADAAPRSGRRRRRRQLTLTED